MTKLIDNFLLFETNHRNLFYTTEKLTAMEQNFSTTDISGTDLRDIKLDQLFVWDFRGMFENLKQIELLNCHIEKLHRAMILTTSINGNSHQIFLSQQNALGTHAERAGGILDKDLELSKRAQSLRHSRKTITGREVFLGQGGLYEHETLEYSTRT